MQILQATSQDLPAIADCHRAAFPEALSTALGRAFVIKMLEWYLVSEDTFLFYAREGNQVIGFCGGLIKAGLRNVGSASGMAQHSFKTGMLAVCKRPWLLFHPELLAKYKLVIKNIKLKITNTLNKRTLPHSNSAAVTDPRVNLVVIAVHPNYQGKGIGSMLLQEFEDIARQKGYPKVLLTVRSNNDQAIKSYSRNGWVISERKGPSTTMVKLLK